MKKILAVLFILTLVATLSVTAVAAETELMDTTISAPVLSSSPAKEIDSAKSYTIKIPDGDVDVVQPIKVTKKGKLYIQAESKVPKQRYIELYSDKNCTVPADSGFRYIKPSEVNKYDFFVAKAGTYYLKLYPQYTSNVSTDSGSIVIKPYLASSANRTLKSGSYTVGASSKTNQMSYFKINITEAGYIGVHQKNPSGKTFDVELCDKSKMKIANCYVGSSNVYYPVKKGTYYLKTAGVSYAYADWYTLKYTFYKQTSSTFTMTNNKVKKMTPFGEATFYFRIKAEKTGTLALTNGVKNGMYVTLCNSKKSALTDEVFSYNDTKYFAVNKGTTYYLKFESGYEVAFKYKITGVSTGSNTTKAKAITLKKGKTQKLNFVAGSTKSYWFKFKASASVKMDLDCVFSGVGYYDLVMYKGSSKYDDASFGSGTKNIVTFSKLTKGATYYLKYTPQKKTTGTIALTLNS